MTCSLAYPPSSSATTLAHTFSSPPKVPEFGSTPSCCSCPAPSVLAHISHVPSVGAWRMLIECSTRCLHVMSTKLVPTKTSKSHPLWMICSWAHLPSSSATRLAYAFSTTTKVDSTLSCWICQNASSAFCPCARFTCPDIMVVPKWPHPEIATCWTLSEHPPCSPHLAYMSMKLHPPQRHHHQPHDHFELCVQLHEPAFPPTSSSALLNLAHALRTGTKESEFVRKHAFLLQILGKAQLVFLMLLPSLNIPCKLSPIVQQSPPTHPPTDGLVGDSLPESDLRLQMFEIRIPCIHILRSTIPPLWRICKELPPKCLGCNCSCCYRWCNFSPPSRCHRSVAASHKLYVLNGATFSQVWVDCALPWPRTRIDGTSKPNRRSSGGVFAAASATAQASQTANSFRRLVQSPKSKAPLTTSPNKLHNGWKMGWWMKKIVW